MGNRGPVPKRSDQRRRANIESRPDIVPVPYRTVPVPELRPGMHPLARRWYAALADSAQAVLYEPSDWLTAQVVAEAIESFALDRRATMLATILSGASSLLATEGDRRRLRVELERVGHIDSDEDAAVAALDDYRRRFTS